MAALVSSNTSWDCVRVSRACVSSSCPQRQGQLAATRRDRQVHAEELKEPGDRRPDATYVRQPPRRDRTEDRFEGVGSRAVEEVKEGQVDRDWADRVPQFNDRIGDEPLRRDYVEFSSDPE